MIFVALDLQLLASMKATIFRIFILSLCIPFVTMAGEEFAHYRAKSLERRAAAAVQGSPNWWFMLGDEVSVDWETLDRWWDAGEDAPERMTARGGSGPSSNNRLFEVSAFNGETCHLDFYSVDSWEDSRKATWKIEKVVTWDSVGKTGYEFHLKRENADDSGESSLRILCKRPDPAYWQNVTGISALDPEGDIPPIQEFLSTFLIHTDPQIIGKNSLAREGKAQVTMVVPERDVILDVNGTSIPKNKEPGSIQVFEIRGLNPNDTFRGQIGVQTRSGSGWHSFDLRVGENLDVYWDRKTRWLKDRITVPKE